MKPRLPTYDKLAPYLKRIDASGVYSNFGPLNAEYCSRLEEVFNAPVVTTSSATSGLTACIMALDLPKGSLVACPSWTFVATPASIVMAGHVPYFVDVKPDGVALAPPAHVRAMVVVAPLGKPLDIKKWDKMKLPIVIDAAAGFDSFSTLCNPGKSPVVISTHATKPFGTGEGGFVTCHNKTFLEKVRRITNFGFTADKKSEQNGFNGKFSEYHAAVGLAELDGWDDKRDKYLRKAKIYGVNYAASLVTWFDGEGRKGVYGCHKHKAFSEFPRMPLPVTEGLMRKTYFIPVSI